MSESNQPAAPEAPASLPRLISPAQVADWLGCTRASVHNMVLTGRLPKPLKLSASCSRFRVDELEAHLAKLQDGESDAAR